MRFFAAVCLIIGFASLAQYGSCQGSASSFGGGGGMGGPGGGSSGRIAQSEDQRRRSDYSLLASPKTLRKSAILTPGDHVEFKFDLDAGEAIVAGVTSDAFDAALEIQDEQGKVLAKNDDRIEGDQSPYLQITVPTKGTYKLRVICFRPTAGGKFDIALRTFRTFGVQPGPVDASLPARKESYDLAYLRFEAKKGHYYSLRNGVEHLSNRNSPVREIKFYGPSGNYDSDVRYIRSVGGATVIQALSDGQFLVELQPLVDVLRVTGNLFDIRVLPVQLGSTQHVQLAPHEPVIVSIPVKKGSDILSKIESVNGVTHLLTAPEPEKNEFWGPRESSIELDPSESWSSHTAFQLKRNALADFLYAFKADGTAELLIVNTLDTAQKVDVELSASLREWTQGAPVSGNLLIGESQFFKLASTKSELMRVRLMANSFLPRLTIYSTEGDILNSLSDYRTNQAADDLYFPVQRDFIVRVNCEGFGGSGNYSLLRETLKPNPYRLGVGLSTDINPEKLALYSMPLQAGKRYELVLEEGGVHTNVDLFDENGNFVPSTRIGFGSLRVFYFEPPTSGTYRLWFRGAPGLRKFNLREHRAPGIDP